VWAVWLFEVQLLRLRADRALGALLRRRRPRVVATACWSFPIYSQTFVYQELTQLIRAGFAVRLLYSELSRTDPFPPQFRPLWRARRRLILHQDVCDRSYAYFATRAPERVETLVALLCGASGMSPATLRGHHHFRQAFAFARMVEAYGPAYLHSYFFYEGTLFALTASWLLSIPRGVSCYADHMLDDYVLKMVPLHLRQCSVIVATSERIRQELLGIEPRIGSAQVLVKPNGINAACFPAVVHRDPAPDEPVRLVCVSRIEPKKGLVYLIEAVGQLRSQGMRLALHLVGGVDDSDASREYHREVRETIRRLGLNDVVHLEGRRSESEINAFFRTAQLFVAPFIETASGDKDGVPTSLLEAMAAGLAIVATDAGSIREAIEDGREGVIVPQRSPQALARAIADLSADAVRRRTLGEQAARRVRESFDALSRERAFHGRLATLLGLAEARGTGAGRPGAARRPLVSIVIIFFNAERFLGDAIESVLFQSYDDWELLLVDDGSSDGSTEIAREHARKQPARIRYVEHEGHQNRGAAAARNLGISKAAGRYVAFLDADDVWLPFKLARQVTILEARPDATVVFGAAEYWHGWTGRVSDRVRDHTPGLGVEADRVYAPPSLSTLLYPLGHGTAPCPSDLLLRRDVFGRVGGFEEQFHGERQLYEDQAFLAKLYLREPVFISSESWIRYRIRDDSCVSVVTRAGRYDAVRRYFLEWLQSHLAEHRLAEPAVSAALEEALRHVARDGPEARERGIRSDGGAPEQGAAPEPIQFGTLRRLTPVSGNWGFDRGLPLDRYYIEQFLAAHSQDIRGHVLEIEDDVYTRRFGKQGVTARDVLHLTEGNERATIVGDLTDAPHIPSGIFDCVILTQTLQYIYDTRAVVTTLERILKPGGVLLATFPGISRIGHEKWPGSWFWGFTTASSRRLFAEVFDPEKVMVEAFGSVLTASAFLYGLAAEELQTDELDHRDPDFEVLIAVRAVKSNRTA
jgi:glycosyltransferase involved in cell wall biosynthesis